MLEIITGFQETRKIDSGLIDIKQIKFKKLEIKRKPCVHTEKMTRRRIIQLVKKGEGNNMFTFEMKMNEKV